MTPHPPPHGINDVDYEAIEAAVTETVRGRWFLNEFARRNRASEMRQLLEAMARVETVVAGQGGPTLPAADPSIRLLVQRIKEIAGHLDGLVRDMREAGVDERFCDAADLQARAVAGMMRNTTGGTPQAKMAPLPKPALVAPNSVTALKEGPLVPVAFAASPYRQVPVVADPPRPEPFSQPAPFPQPAPPAETTPLAEPAPRAAGAVAASDPRLAALSGFDGLPLAKKLALFT